MKIIKRWFAIAMSVLMTAGLTVGCSEGMVGNSGGSSGITSEEVSFPYYPKKTQMKEDGQLYSPEGIEFPDSLWQTPKAERYETLDRDGVQAYFINSLDNTQVFCYVGLPAGASAENSVPAVVLVHGALGTAFYDWVRAWNDRGYAAIAMDTEGRIPSPEASTYHSVFETSVKPHGPANASFTDCSKPVSEQWVYHALASVIVSNSFIRSFREVDSSRVGITGVSYGGFLTCLAVGFDDRFSFAAPVYGCLSNEESAGEFGTYINNNAGADLWDGTGSLTASSAPILFVNSDTDRHFTVDSASRCVKASKYAALTLIPGLTHGHAQGAEVKEVFAFADEICFGKTPLVRITSDPENGELKIALPEGVTLAETVQRYTLSETLNDETEWEKVSVDYDESYVFFSSESFKKHFYISIKDSRGYYISSTVV